MATSALLTLLAVALAVFGNVLNAVGFTVEKLGHRDNIRKNRGKSESERKGFVFNKIWISGILLYGTGSAIIAAAMSFGPQSLLVPMESVTLVSNVYLSNRILQEPLRQRDLVGTAIIFIGVIMVIVFGPRAGSATGEYTTADLARMYLTVRVIVLFTGLITIALTAYLTLDAIRTVFKDREIDVLRVSIGGMPSVSEQLQRELARMNTDDMQLSVSSMPVDSSTRTTTTTISHPNNINNTTTTITKSEEMSSEHHIQNSQSDSNNDLNDLPIDIQSDLQETDTIVASNEVDIEMQEQQQQSNRLTQHSTNNSTDSRSSNLTFRERDTTTSTHHTGKSKKKKGSDKKDYHQLTEPDQQKTTDSFKAAIDDKDLNKRRRMRSIDERSSNNNSGNGSVHFRQAYIMRLFPGFGTTVVDWMTDLREEKLGALMLVCLCLMASVSSSWNFLCTKSVSEIVASSSAGKAKQNWSHPLTYILMMCVVIASVFTEYWRQGALKLFGALHVVPIVQVTLLTGGVITGAVYFDELSHLIWWRVTLFCLAICVDIVGIIVISWPGEKVDLMIERISSNMSLRSLTYTEHSSSTVVR